MKPERMMCERADGFYTELLKRKAFLGIVQVNNQFRQVEGCVNEIVEEKNYNLVQQAFSSWKQHYYQYKNKEETLQINARFLMQLKAYRKWRKAFIERVDYKEKMEQAQKFYTFITLKKCYKVLTDHKIECQRLKYI